MGAGATQAEVNYLGATPVNLLMRDSAELGGEGLSTGILRKLGKAGQRFTGTDRGIDIEKLISLLTNVGVNSQSQLAETMRKLYFQEICNRLVKSKVIRRPTLATGLLEMHHNETFRNEVEVLSAILTTNHDGLFQLASQRVFGEVDLGFPFTSDELTPAEYEQVPPILQLHGSFSWTFGLPLKVEPLKRGSTYSAKSVWIPPTVLKESKHYPFNKIGGIAYEILSKRCDVLRIVGASLTQNDWNIISLIFNAQRHRELVRGASFVIQFIMSRRSGEEIQTNCSYLKNTFPINHLSEGDFKEYETDELPPESELRNAFAYWMREKLKYHLRRGELGNRPITGALAQVAGEAV